MKRISLTLAAIAMLVIVIVWMAGGFNEQIEPGQQAAAPLDNSAETQTLSPTQLQGFEAVAASLAAEHNTDLSSQVMARIAKIQVRAGDSVTAGQTLITLEQEDSRSVLAQAEAQLKATQVQRQDAERQNQRVSELAAKGLASKAERDRAQAQLDTLTAQVKQAEQSLSQAKANLSYRQIAAPIDGVIVDRFAEEGDMANPGKPLLSLYNPQALRVEAKVRESLAVDLVVGQQLTVEIPALELTTTALITQVVPAADSNSRSVTIKAKLEAAPQLRPGLYASLQIPTETRDALLIDDAYLVRQGQLQMVYVKTEQGLSRRIVELSQARYQGKREILSGLQAGEQLVMPPTR
ncbi:efflux RND transporter periplasmic adaptor subunit [Paraferrimonas sedimenticola]|uniref:Hemolysin D n=1 Tax=Paraferrimonas sedimenticola TaxID=375674 RepID=A0AA37RYV0_9GAMM|nr:efflux RND transporter periplasmic adaptor subunit [Paraferrimonas sedimenticola]GLP97995.1 hemolysin D [Paraferrimonas sedimenticola]